MEDNVFQLSDLITASFIGSLVTLIIKATIDAIMAGRLHRRELLKEVFKRRTDAAEKAMSWYQEALDNYTLLQQACNAFGGDIDEFAFEKFNLLLSKSSNLFEGASTRLNIVYLYFDFSKIENKYGAYKSNQKMNYIIEELARLDSASYQVEKDSSEWKSLYKQAIENIKELSLEFEVQRKAIIEMQMQLRNEYKQ